MRIDRIIHNHNQTNRFRVSGAIYALTEWRRSPGVISQRRGAPASCRGGSSTNAIKIAGFYSAFKGWD